jgi:hypothetical protein
MSVASVNLSHGTQECGLSIPRPPIATGTTVTMGQRAGA